MAPGAGDREGKTRSEGAGGAFTSSEIRWEPIRTLLGEAREKCSARFYPRASDLRFRKLLLL